MKGHAQGGYWYATAVQGSDLPMPARCVALVLASVADNATGQVTMSLGVLASRSGASKSTVKKYLNVLEAEGFLTRARPTTWQSLGQHEMTRYTLLIPEGYQHRTGPTDLGREATPLGRESAEPRPSDDLALGRESAEPRPRDGHRSIDLKGARPHADAQAATPTTTTRAPHLYEDDGSEQSCRICGLSSKHANHKEAA